MKKISFLLLFILSMMTFAQNGFNYKALITDNGNAIANQTVNLKFTVLENGTTSVYQETQSATTDANGILSLSVGEGTVASGNFSTIDWGSNAYFLKVEIDTGSGYQDFGTSELKYVPYAKYAERVGIADNIQGIPVSTTTPNNGQVLKYNGTQFVPADDDTSGGSGTDGVVNSAAFSGTSTKTLTLARSNGLGNLTATFTDAVNDADHSATNEIQHISKNGNTISLSNGGGSVTDADTHLTDAQIGTMGYIKNANDADHDTSNELQNLTLNNIQLSISNGNQVNFTGWDTDASDDFSGDYNDLSNQPHVWNDSGTSNAATSNTHSIVHSGNIGIGTGTIPGSNHAKLYISNGGSGSAYGVESHISGNGNSVNKFGYSASINTSGNGFQAGLHTYINNTSNAVNAGVDNYIHSGGTMQKYGVKNYLNGSGTGDKYGVSNQIEGAGTGMQIGTNNNLEGTGTGMQVGTMNRIDNDNDNMQGGTVNLIHGDGNGMHIGNYSELDGTGNGIIYAVADSITNTGTGIHVGNYSYLSGGDGVHYGTLNAFVDGDGIHVGTSNILSGSGNGFQVGYHTVIENDGSGMKFGNWTMIDSDTGAQVAFYADMDNDTPEEKNGFAAYLTGDGTGNQFGFRGELSGTGNGKIYAVADTISNSGNGTQYGVYSYLNGSGTGYHFGSYNKLEGSGTGHHYGNYNTLSGSGYQIGNYNSISNSGTQNSLGTRNQLSGSGNGTAYGTYNYINNTGSGVHYGVYNSLGSGTGAKYGTYNKITATTAGTQIAVYGKVKDGTGNYAGKFEGDVQVTKKLVAPDSGDADMKAYIYGYIYPSGTHVNIDANKSSSGFSVQKVVNGKYRITISGTGITNYVVTANAIATANPRFVTYVNNGQNFDIYIWDVNGHLIDSGVSFVVYKK